MVLERKHFHFKLANIWKNKDKNSELILIKLEV